MKKLIVLIPLFMIFVGCEKISDVADGEALKKPTQTKQEEKNIPNREELFILAKEISSRDLKEERRRQ
ncbi:MAG: hypothetical protein LBH27_02315 [Endomicrobium sp.]|jgi:hypothetical protein|nr:hypothetical protein [Endomicrobium sp.]